MGAWGYYSDENDNTADHVISVEEFFLPKKIVEASDDIININYELYREIKNKYIENNKKEIYKKIEKYIKTQIDKEDLRGKLGILLNYAREFSGLDIPDLFSKLDNKNIPFPMKLPKDFPKQLALLGEKITEKIIDLNMKCEEGWGNGDLKDLALNHELYLFSNGKKGISPKIKKTKTNIGYCPNEDDKKSKKGSKKSSKRRSKKGSKKGSKKRSKKVSKKGSKKN